MNHNKKMSEKIERTVCSIFNCESPGDLFCDKSRPPTVEQILNEWMNKNSLKNKGGTVYKYRYMIDAHILPYLGNIAVSELTPQMICSFLKYKIDHGRLDGKGGLSAAYVKEMMIILKSALDLASNEKICNKVVFPSFKSRAVKKELRVLTRSEQETIECHIMRSEKPTDWGILLSLRAGLRVGEVCALKWDDIDFDSGILNVRKTVARVGCLDSEPGGSKLIIDNAKTATSERLIPISEALSLSLLEFKAHSQSEYVVSESSDFISPSTYEYRYRKLLRALNIPFINYHALRHTFATRCIEAGVDLKSLSEMLGHSSVTTTMDTYVHSSIDMKRTQIKKLYDYIDNRSRD